jgi:hypothetical protein
MVRLKVGSKHHTFEMHPRMGPIRYMADGVNQTQNQWAENSTFWPVFNKWLRGGQQVDQYGRGIIPTTDSKE